ncbi:MAG: arylesterase [Hyphomicrobiaceae bacterium]|nr:arylesterase [Hyphomicrobiaceae bacterium]
MRYRSRFGKTHAWIGLGLALVAIVCGFHMSQSFATEGRTVRIVALGDSLTAGYGLAPSAAFPVQLATALKSRGHNVEIINAGVSGDTTAGGLERLDWAVGADADAVILELGANDALRGIPPDRVRQNLAMILDRLQARRLPVLVAGMRAIGNWGDTYTKAFDPIFPDLARQHGFLLYPFFLEGVATEPRLNLDDGLHPNADGIAKIVEGILPKVEELIAIVRARDLEKT